MRENAVMSSTPFSARGAVDLGALATARQNQQKAAQAMANAPAGVVIDVTTENFQAEVIDRSMQVPVVLDLWAEWCGPCKQLSPILEKLAADDGGRWVLAKVDVDAEQQIAAAFQVQSIPSVFAVIAGQPVPLFQGAYPESQIRQILDELLRVAAEQGVAGTLAAEAPEGASPEPEVIEPPVDPRFEAAYDAIEAGDWDAARAAYQAVLAASPADPDAAAGLAMVGPVRPHGRPRRARCGSDGARGRRLRRAAQRLAGGLRPGHRRRPRHRRATIARRPGHGCSSTSCSPATTRPCRRPARRLRAPCSDRLAASPPDLVPPTGLRPVHGLVATSKKRLARFVLAHAEGGDAKAGRHSDRRAVCVDETPTGPAAGVRRSPRASSRPVSGSTITNSSPPNRHTQSGARRWASR